MQLKKIILAGGSGFLGQGIIKKFNSPVTQIVVLTRAASRQDKNITYINWDGKTLGAWALSLEGADALINLTGKSINTRYTEKNKSEIISSRVQAAKVLGEAVMNSQNPPKVWLNCSSAAIYPFSEERPADEYTAQAGSGFTYEVCRQWEQSFNASITPKTRKAALRITMVLGKSGGVLPVMVKLARAGLGGQMGSGRQYTSWIHEQDFLNAILFIIENENCSGAYNLTAPEPITNKQFMKLLRLQLHKKIGLPAASWMMAIGAFFLRTETELMLKSRRVVPTRLLHEGFKFSFSELHAALGDLLEDES